MMNDIRSLPIEIVMFWFKFFVVGVCFLPMSKVDDASMGFMVCSFLQHDIFSLYCDRDPFLELVNTA